MYNITICIATYKRTLMLKELILSISKCDINNVLIKDINIIIVDNDIEKTAESIIIELKEDFNNIYKLHYFNHPIKGISNVRNELIEKAYLTNPDYLVFIDDDEYVTLRWLNELVKTIINNDADAVRGPVLAVLDKTVSEYISYWFKRESYIDNSQINVLTTGNLILKCSSLKRYDVWFDYRFNIIGSGDYYFGLQILKRGAKIYWAANAIAYETIPKKRANIKWLIKRIYRDASTYTYILKLEREYIKLFKKILFSICYILLGCCAIIIIPIPIKKRYWGILTLTEGIGGLAGIGNLLYKEYK